MSSSVPGSWRAPGERRNPCGLLPGRGVYVQVEALGEAEVAVHPAVAEDARRHEARLLEDLRGHACRHRQAVLEAHHAGAVRVEAGPERRHRGLGPARLRLDPREAYAGARDLLERGARGPCVAVGGEPVGAQRVDQDEHHVQVAALPERAEIFDLAARPGGQAHLHLGDEQRDQQRDPATDQDPPSQVHALVRSSLAEVGTRECIGRGSRAQGRKEKGRSQLALRPPLGSGPGN